MPNRRPAVTIGARGAACLRMPRSAIIGADSTMRSNQRRPWRAARMQHGGAHRMAERKDRRRAIRQHDLLHEGLQVDVVFGEIADMALQRIGSRRSDSPCPRQSSVATAKPRARRSLAVS